MTFDGKVRHAPLTKAEEDAVIVRAVRGEAGAMAEMTARYRGLIVAEAYAPYLRGTALAAEAENVAALAFLEALHDYDAQQGVPFAGFVKARVHHALIAEFRRELRRRARTCAPPEEADGQELWRGCAADHPAPYRGAPWHERGRTLQEQGKSPAKTACLCGSPYCNGARNMIFLEESVNL